MNNSDDILVKFSDVTKQYGDLVVLDKLNLEIKKNEMVSIIGPSGSGKTTVLRALMTLEKIDKGIIYLENEPLTHMLDKEGKLTKKGKKRNSMTAAERAKDRASKASGRPASDYKYNVKTNSATLKKGR